MLDEKSLDKASGDLKEFDYEQVRLIMSKLRQFKNISTSDGVVPTAAGIAPTAGSVVPKATGIIPTTTLLFSAFIVLTLTSHAQAQTPVSPHTQANPGAQVQDEKLHAQTPTQTQAQERQDQTLAQSYPQSHSQNQQNQAQGHAPSQQQKHNFRVLIASVEQTRIFQTGGLAHATTDLAKTLNQAGVSTDVLMPYYLQMNVHGTLTDIDQNYNVLLDWRHGRAHKESVFTVKAMIESDLNTGEQELKTYFLKHDHTDEIVNYFDNRAEDSTQKFYGPAATIGESFGAYSKAAAEFILQNSYDIVILNDWTSGLIATHLHDAKVQGRKTPKVVFAIHNIAYQGVFPKSLVDFLGLPEQHFNFENGYEFHGQVNFLKAGIQYSDEVYTVSPQYAIEIATRRFGHGLDGLIRRKRNEGRLIGILNGIDNSKWEPAHPVDPQWPSFSANDLAGKALGKQMLQKQFHLPEDASAPLVISTSRLAEQKGFEYLFDAIRSLASRHHIQFILIGDGESRYIHQAQQLEHDFKNQIRYARYSITLEHLLMNYGDFFINAAWFEPCGLNQFYALRNGAIPVVSCTGGLKDSIQDDVTGFHFIVPEDGSHHHPYDKWQAQQAIINVFEQKVLKLYNDDPVKLNQMRVAGMQEDHSWLHQVNEIFIPMFYEILRDQNDNTSDCAQVISAQVRNTQSINR